jgi:hypothetical protein
MEKLSLVFEECDPEFLTPNYDYATCIQPGLMLPLLHEICFTLTR